MGDSKVCDTNLTLTIGCYGDHVVTKRENKSKNKKCVTYLDLSLSYKEEAIEDMEDDNAEDSKSMVISENGKQNENISSSFNKDDIKDGVRQKLMLTRGQSNFLEEKFKCHPILTMTQKQVIASQLNLKSRQVEVWFQNRRARTKLKKIEEDYEFLKKFYDSLSHENKRLRRELQELRSFMFTKQTSP